MLNLKELERKLDQALSLETDESLTQWLFEKRFGKKRFDNGRYTYGIDTHRITKNICTLSCLPVFDTKTSICEVDCEKVELENMLDLHIAA